MKIVKRGSKPLNDIEFDAIKTLAEEINFHNPQKMGVVFDKEVMRSSYINKVLSFIDYSRLKPLKL